MNMHPHRWPRLATSAVALTLVWLAHPAAGAALEDFGYNHMTINGREARGHRPLLLILIQFADGPVLAHAAAFYDDLMFNSTSTNSLNGFLLENSNGRFNHTRAGLVGPLFRPATESYTNYEAQVPNNTPLVDTLYLSNIVAQAMRAGFNFTPFDTNGDGTVTAEELAIATITNDGEKIGANRPSGLVPGFGPSVPVNNSKAGQFHHRVAFATLAHEMSHSLGATDLYGSGCLSYELTLMTCTLQYLPESPIVFHLDPWHKMQLGWNEPRLRRLQDGGAITLPATQLKQSDAPVLLYDPDHGTQEFFLLEYRTASIGSGPGYDRNVAGNGLVLWHVVQQDNDPLVIPAIGSGPYLGQPDWAWCGRCQGLAYQRNGAPSRCPATGNHNHTGSTDYMVVNVPTPSGSYQHGWRWCRNCGGLFYGPLQSTSVCPAGGPHDGSGSGDYSLAQDDPSADGQHDWRWCSKCQGLFYNPNQATSVCPRSGQHDGSTSSDYSLVRNALDRTVFTRGAPDLNRGGNVVWTGGSTTPRLRWLDGTELPNRIYVRPFSPGDSVITIELLREDVVWVDFAAVFPIEAGSFTFPFHTLAGGVAAATWGGTVRIKAGTASETGTFAKRTRLEAYGSRVTIGRR